MKEILRKLRDAVSEYIGVVDAVGVAPEDATVDDRKNVRVAWVALGEAMAAADAALAATDCLVQKSYDELADGDLIAFDVRRFDTVSTVADFERASRYSEAYLTFEPVTLVEGMALFKELPLRKDRTYVVRSS